MARLQSLSFETATTIATVSSSSIDENLFTLNSSPGTYVRADNTGGNTLAFKFGIDGSNSGYERETGQANWNNWKDSTIAGASDYDSQGVVFIYNIGGNRYTVQVPDVNNEAEYQELVSFLNTLSNQIYGGTGFTVLENTDGLSEGDAVTSEEFGSILNVTITPPISVTTDSYEITGSLTVTGTSTIVLPTSDPGVSGALWNDSGTISISAG